MEAEDPRRDRQASKLQEHAGMSGSQAKSKVFDAFYCKDSVEGSSDRAQRGTSKCGREVQIGLAVCETGLVERAQPVLEDETNK